jgi:pyruvate dehydrogenase E2 component (dihydrolipoamide acetyltransferase)
MELESYEDGTLLYIGVEAGASVVVDGVLAIVGEKGADYKALLQGPKTQPAKDANGAAPKAEEKASAPAATPAVQTAETTVSRLRRKSKNIST